MDSVNAVLLTVWSPPPSLCSLRHLRPAGDAHGLATGGDRCGEPGVASGNQYVRLGLN